MSSLIKHTKHRCQIARACALLWATIFGITGCTRSIDVTEQSLASPASYKGLFKFETVDGALTVREFTIDDSTVVVTKLSGSDKRYGDVSLPIVISETNIISISRLETSRGKTALVLAGLVVGTILILAAAGLDFPAVD